uniref:Uncharacterized protein n=1 Tax=Ixodes ricinus TaxID=34613 RepID=A0A6B0U505_IXORI
MEGCWQVLVILGGVECRSPKTQTLCRWRTKGGVCRFGGDCALSDGRRSVCTFGSDEMRRRQTNNERQTVFVAVN